MSCVRVRVCVRVCVGVQERFFFHPQLFVHPHFIYVGAGSKKKKTAAVVDFFSPRLNFKDVEAPRRAVCNECRFFFVRTVLFIPKQKKKKEPFYLKLL